MSPESPQILVVDDDRAERLLLRRLLGKDGYHLEFAEDGEQGLEMASSLQPDLILLDVIMPKMDGFEVCRRLRSDPKVAEVPVLMITALDDQSSRVDGLEAGADDFITKPFKPPELRARVKTICRLNRYRRIRAERARFDWVVENAEEGYVVVDDGGRVVYANEKAKTLFSLPQRARGKVLKRYFKQFQLVPEEAWESFPRLGEGAQLVRPDTPSAPASWLSMKSVTHHVGNEAEHLLQVRDITAEHNSQRSVWTFEALIAHKLRTPMTKMTWGLSFIEKKADKLTVDKIREFAKMSRDGVDQLQTELDDVLSYLNAPTAAPNGEGFRLERLESLLDEIAGELQLTPIDLEMADTLPEAIYLSDRATGLVLWELLRNSKKFHPKQQPWVQVEVKKRKNKVLFEFKDDGSTLSPEQLRNAFKPYYQGEKYFTGQVPGMGLGLPMIRGILLEVGGRCNIRNRADGEGVVFDFSVPATSHPHGRAPSAAE